MEFKDFFDMDIAFNPEFFKLTTTILGGHSTTDYLYANSRKYPSFLENKLWKPVATKMGIKNSSEITFTPRIVIFSASNEQTGLASCEVRFELTYYLHAFLRKYGIKAEEIEGAFEKGDNESILQEVRNVIRNKRKKFDDISKKGTSSEYYNQIKTEFNQKDEDMLAFVKSMSQTYVLISTRIMRLAEIFNKKIDKEELKCCFDYDVFCLIMAKSILDTAKTQKFLQGYEADLVYIARYLRAVKKYRIQNPTYNCFISLTDISTKKTDRYSIYDLDEEYQQYLSQHPDKIPQYITVDEFQSALVSAGYPELTSFDLLNSSKVSKAKSFLEKWNTVKTLSKSWKIFPKDTNTSPSVDDIDAKLNTSTSTLPDKEKIRRMLIAYHHLESSDYLFKIEGINEFEGYIGYVYKTGKVVLEKFYDNVNTKKVATNCATYIIKDFNKFVEISMLSKTEIIKRIQSGELSEYVEREYHRSNMERWKAKMEQVFQGGDYTEKIIEYINALINQGKLQKKTIS